MTFKVKEGVQVGSTLALDANGKLTTGLSTGRSISLSGDVAGSATFDGTSNITISTTVQANSVALGTDTTGNYMLDVTAGTGVTVSHTQGEGSTATVSIGQPVATTSNVTFANINASGNLVIDGNLTVNGTTTTISAANLAIEDNLIYLNEGSTTANPDLGITGNYNDGTYAHAGVFRDATDNRWKFFKGYTPEPGTSIDTTHASFAYADVQAGTFYGAFSGNASTASIWQTARTLSYTGDATGSMSVNGSADVSAVLTLANSGVTAGSYGSGTAIPVLTIDAKGRITAASTSAVTIGNSGLTLSIGTAGATNTTVTVGTGTGFTSNATSAYTYDIKVGPALTNLAALMTTAGAGFIKRGATADTYTIDTNTYLTGTKVDSISATTPIVASASTGAVTLSHASSGVTAGTYNNVTVNATGHVTSASNASYASSTHYHDRIYNGASGSSSYLALSSTNELEYYNASGVIDTLYLQYSGTAAQLKGPAGAQIWMDSNDGSGSGLDADLLDGNHASAFALAGHTHSYLSAESDTLATVTARGASTSTLSTFSGGIVASAGIYGAGSGAPDVPIWMVSTANPTWGIFYNEGTPDYIEFKAGGTVTSVIELDAGSHRAPIFYDYNDTSYYLDPNSTGTSLIVAGTIEQGNNYAHPNIEWSVSGNTTGEVIFYLPGTTANYGMVHMVFDIYEYNSNNACTVIVGGHNWSTSWYNVGVDVIGYTDKQVRLGVKDGRFVVVFGNTSSTWSYGQIRLRKIQNGSYYNNQMDLGGNWSVVLTTTESFSNISGDLRELRTSNTMYAYAYRGHSNVAGTGEASYHPAGIYSTGTNWLYGSIITNNYSINAGTGTIESGRTYGYTDIRSPIFYDYNDTAYYLDAASTSRLNTISSYRFQDGDATFLFRIGSTSGTTRHINLADSTSDPSSVGSGSGITWGQRTDSNPYYMLYCKPPYNNGYSTHSRLTLAWHTGIEIGASSSYGGTRFFNNSPFTGSEIMRVGAGDNNVYINNTGTAGGDFRAPIYYDSNNTGYYVDPASTTYINILTTAGNITSNSDIRLKRDIQKITNATDKVKKLNGVTFTRIDVEDTTKRYAGLIAQEVLEVLPEAVEGTATYSVAYGNMVGLLVEAIKEQQSEIDELKSLVKQLLAK